MRFPIAYHRTLLAVLLASAVVVCAPSLFRTEVAGADEKSIQATDAPTSASVVTSARVTFVDEKKRTHDVEGTIVVEAADGGILFLGRDLQMWPILPEQIQKRDDSDVPFKPLTKDELVKDLKNDFGEGFNVVSTKHYLICTNASKEYADWCGLLFERLMGAFLQHWKSGKLGIDRPDWPLVAVVFSNRNDYARYTAGDAGPEAAASARGYYSVRTNRMVMYDLSAEGNARPVRSVEDVNRRMALALGNVSTIVHEATHQIAFNCGLQRRFADNPLWLTEGMATYFETPDIDNRAGWKSLGRVNVQRQQRFLASLERRAAGSLATLVSTDARFTEPEAREDAYAEAWALNYFLIKTRRKEYYAYLKKLSQRPPLKFGSPEDRLTEFRAAFGDDLEKLDGDFVRYMRRK